METFAECYTTVIPWRGINPLPGMTRERAIEVYAQTDREHEENLDAGRLTVIDAPNDDNDAGDDGPPDAGDLQFTGLQLYRDADDNLCVRWFNDGMITELAPNESDQSRALGFYDLRMNPVADPFTGGG